MFVPTSAKDKTADNGRAYTVFSGKNSNDETITVSVWGDDANAIKNAGLSSAIIYYVPKGKFFNMTRFEIVPI